MPLRGELIHCTDGYKNEAHPAIDTGEREEREDGTYRHIKWVTNDKFTWVHESKVVVLSRKRQRSKTQRLSEEGVTPFAAKQARNEDDDNESYSAPSNGRRNRSKRSPKAPTSRSGPRRKLAPMKSKPVYLSDISMNSDESDDVTSIYDERKPAYKRSTRTTIRRSPRNKRQHRTGGNETSPIDLCSGDEEEDEETEEAEVEAEVEPDEEAEMEPEAEQEVEPEEQDVEELEEAEEESEVQVAGVASDDDDDDDDEGEASSFFAESSSIQTQYFSPLRDSPEETQHFSPLRDSPSPLLLPPEEECTLSVAPADTPVISHVHRRRKLMARKSTTAEKAANASSFRLPFKRATLFPEKVEGCPVAAGLPPTRDGDDDEPHTSEIDDEPVESEAEDDSFVTAKTHNEPAPDKEDSPAPTRIRTHTKFYQPERLSPPKVSAQKQARKEPRLSTESSATMRSGSYAKRKSLSKDNRRRREAAVLSDRWTAKDLRNTNRYLLDA